MTNLETVLIFINTTADIGPLQQLQIIPSGYIIQHLGLHHLYDFTTFLRFLHCFHIIASIFGFCMTALPVTDMTEFTGWLSEKH